MDPATRSRVMSRIRGRDTGPERTLAKLLADAGLIAELQPRGLPGKPDFVLRDHKLAIFVDGDFWHGWRFSRWKMKLSEKWEKKIESNRLRDARIGRQLRRQGWKVIRIWEHQIEKSPDFCVNRIRRQIAVALCKRN
jgi:DNA mismatch endonuclease (patch repair protein)